MNSSYEIEYKYLVSPEKIAYQDYPFYDIEQAYISTSPVIRIRKRNEEYFLTIKGKGNIKHLEYELPICQSEYIDLKKKTEGYIISKRRYCIPYFNKGKEYLIELDIFEGEFAGLVLAEVEFSSEEEAKQFEAPDWFLENVSCNPQFHNSFLAKRGWKN